MMDVSWLYDNCHALARVDVANTTSSVSFGPLIDGDSVTVVTDSILYVSSGMPTLSVNDTIIITTPPIGIDEVSAPPVIRSGQTSLVFLRRLASGWALYPSPYAHLLKTQELVSQTSWYCDDPAPSVSYSWTAFLELVE